MNENIDLTKILKDCPKGTKLYSPIYGEVTFTRISIINTILCKAKKSNGEITSVAFNRLGKIFREFSNSECVLFPSKDQRDWSKFAAHRHNKEKFDPSRLIRYW